LEPHFANLVPMKRRDIVIGVIVLAAAVGVYFYGQKLKKDNQPKVPQTLSSQDNTEQNIENKFNLQIPDDLEKAILKDRAGGNSQAIATRKWSDGQFSFDILADLPEPESGFLYQGFLIRGNEGEDGYSVISVGQFTIAKGGWLIHYESSNNYSDYTKVVVSLQQALSERPEKPVLQGSF
jgi:hypothetical protein